MEHKNEEWKQIFVNNKGTNYYVSSLGRIRNNKTKKILKGTYARNEYHSVQLMIDGKPKTFMTHRLVAEAFVSNPKNHQIVDHIDRNKYNNNATNLRWTTDSLNVRNSTRNIDGVSQDFYYEGNIDNFVNLFHSDEKYLVSESGIVINKNTHKILKGTKRNGYVRFNLKDKMYSAHCLIWESFNGPIPVGFVVDHINGIRDDNRLTNLRLITQSDNVKNSYDNGHDSQKEVYQYSLDGNFVKKYARICLAAQDYQVSGPAISSAAKRKGTCAGYFWSFSKMSNEDIDSIIEKNKSRSNSEKVTRYDLDGSNPKYYYSIGEAAEDIGCPKTTISRGIKGKRAAKGYYWILDSQKDEITIQDLLNK